MPTRFLVFESITASGLGRHVNHPAHSLYCEGLVMRNAIVEDFQKLPNVEVLLPPIENQHWDQNAFQSLVCQADFALVIAPELNGELTRYSKWLDDTKVRSLGSSLTAIEHASDKLALAETWHQHKVPTPKTVLASNAATLLFPIVMKPRDGAGSTVTRKIDQAQNIPETLAELQAEYLGEFIAQPFVAGVAVSVSLLISATQMVPLLPSVQCIDAANHFAYRGGEFTLNEQQKSRAVALATKAVACIRGLRGYVGVDMILGETEDVVLEINPRLTTSYFGLQKMTDANLAEMIWQCASGEQLKQPVWKPQRLKFTSMGDYHFGDC